MVTYRTRTGQEAHLWQQRLEAQVQRRCEQIQALLDHHLLPPDTEPVGDENLLIGLLWGAETPVPAGWRHHRTRSGVITPDQSTPHGQALAQDLGAVVHGNGALLLPGGMPASVQTNGRLVLPQVRCEHEYLWAVWPCPLPDTVPVDPDVWERQ